MHTLNSVSIDSCHNMWIKDEYYYNHEYIREFRYTRVYLYGI